MRPLLLRGGVAAAVVVPCAVALASGPQAATTAALVAVARRSAPVVLTGAQIPGWTRSAAQGLAQPYPSGATDTGDSKRSAHNGRLVVPPDVRTGVDPGQVTAFSWDPAGHGHWREIPVQVDQRFPYFLANGRSSFSVYSGTDEELTYSWAPDAHDTGEEAWKKVFGTCDARMANSPAEVEKAIHSNVVSPGPQETPADYLAGHAMHDPVRTLDDDDEVSFMARDAGPKVPAGTPPPAHSRDGQVVTIVDPLDPAVPTYVYLFLRPGGSSFTWRNSPYVHMVRDANADQWIDRYSFAPDDPEKIGVSNTGYGPNIPGTVCVTAAGNDGHITAPDGTPRPSIDRVPRDGMTVLTPTYRLHASGRWLVRSLQLARPGTNGSFATARYGPDLISRWKGRAFQQSPDSSISLVGFEDEQVNWEANSALLGWRAGPVRAIREVWGADSGTNVTKTEYYYRDADVFAYHVRVHPIPPDGLYTSWDYNPGAVTRYYNLERPNGVPIDGVNDDVGNVDYLPGAGLPCPYRGAPKQPPCPGDPAEFDAPDPAFDAPSAVDRPEEAAGPNGGLVYEFEFTGATSLVNAAAVPYYRDDACLDDGTGDAPVPRPWPGEASFDPRVKAGYVSYWQAFWSTHPAWQRFAEPQTYADLRCDPAADPRTTPPWRRTPFQGAFGQHGIHFFFTGDSDNLFGPKPVDEIDGQQWRFEVPMSSPRNVLVPYGLNVSVKLQPVVTPFSG